MGMIYKEANIFTRMVKRVLEHPNEMVGPFNTVVYRNFTDHSYSLALWKNNDKFKYTLLEERQGYSGDCVLTKGFLVDRRNYEKVTMNNRYINFCEKHNVLKYNGEDFAFCVLWRITIENGACVTIGDSNEGMYLIINL